MLRIFHPCHRCGPQQYMNNGTMLAVWMLLVWSVGGLALRCDRRPFRTTFAPSVSTGRFRLEIPATKYLPQQQYVVTLSSDDESHAFRAFMVWPEGQVDVTDPRNPRARTVRDAGLMRIHEGKPVKISDKCPNTIEMINAAPTDEVKMYWESPGRGNGCVTLHAMVAESDEVWYQDGEGLILEICEDDTFLGDMSAAYNENCTVCEEAKYEITFEGKWSRNTHPQHFPESEWRVYYGDLVGASHSRNYSMWKDGSTASEAMQALALHNDTSLIEAEILKAYAEGHVRTLIKGKGHGPMGNGDMFNPTYSLVRVDNVHHLISTATALRPSPDWFLGVSEFELCQADNTWLPYKQLDVIPWDAGCNKAISYESPPEIGDHEPIGRVRVGSFDRASPFYNMNYKQVKPFATLTIRLVRTYPKQCEEQPTPVEGEVEGEGEKGPEPEPPSRRTSPSPEKEPAIPSRENSYNGGDGGGAPDGDEECPLSEWDEWGSCSTPCGDGYRSRQRYHLVNGVEYRYYRPDEPRPKKIEEPSQECLERHQDDMMETEPCTSECTAPKELLAEASELVSRQSRMAAESGSWDQQHCLMSAWSRWSACSGPCGGGTQMRTRSIIMYPRNGGRPCPKRRRHIKPCIPDSCIPISMDY